MVDNARKHVWSGFWITSLGTLASRILGLVRDIATASLLGLGEGGVMDAFVIAFRVPNLLRRIFGEGALAASFLPVFTAEYRRQPARAWQLTSVLFTVLAVVLTLLALIGEGICALLWGLDPGAEHGSLLLGLTAAMLPYLVFICLSAQASAALQAMLEFRWPALAPSLLNVCWLAAAWGIAPLFEPNKSAQAYTIAIAILISGWLQLAVQLPSLRRLGFRYDFNWPAARESFWQVARAMLPITLGTAVTQLNTLLDSLIAWGLSSNTPATETIAWLGGAVHYPLQSGAAAAIYYGERFYQLPVGLLGIAIATVIYPLLSRHAARGEQARIGTDLTLGLRLIWFTALPAGLGIMLIAEPLTKVLFERGEFDASDATRAARMIAAYASGVWAYCAIPVLVRGFYAAGDRATPARLGMVAVGVNFALNVTLIWPLAEIGLALSTAAAAALQVLLLTIRFSRTASPLAWRELSITLVKGTIAAAAMSLAVLASLHFSIAADTPSRAALALQLAAAIALGVIVYLTIAWALRMPELKVLMLRSPPTD